MSKVVWPVAAFVAFTAYTVAVAAHGSPVDFFAGLTPGGWPLQVLVDLGVAAACFWIVALPDARDRGIRVWPYVLCTPLVGSIALLAYFAHRSLRPRTPSRP